MFVVDGGDLFRRAVKRPTRPAFQIEVGGEPFERPRQEHRGEHLRHLHCYALIDVETLFAESNAIGTRKTLSSF